MKRLLWLRAFRRWFARPTAPARSGRGRLRRPAIRPVLEGLEDRTLLSVNTYVVNLGGDNGGAAGISTGQFSGDLRYCITQADNPNNAGSTITFDTKAIGSKLIALQNSELEISDNMTITGPGPSFLTISGNNANRVFNVTSHEAVVTISGLTISDGNASPTTSQFIGNQGGDVFNGGTLTLTNDVIQNGRALGIIGGPPGRGGGIFNAEGQSGQPGATLTLNNTIVQNNLVQGNGGLGAGGGIYNDINATLILNAGTQLLNNRALGDSAKEGEGGGVFNHGTLTISGSTIQPVLFSDNLALGGNGLGGLSGGPGSGGARGSDGFSGTDGKAGGAGSNGKDGGAAGAGRGGGVFNDGTLTAMTQATFAGNTAQGGVGGTGGSGGRGGNGGDGGKATNSAGNGGNAGRGGVGGVGGNGGAGGDAQGGGLYSSSGLLTMDGVQFTTDGSGIGNQALSGNGGAGGAGGAGGIGGNGGDGGSNGRNGNGGTGGQGGLAGNGGDSGLALGGSMFNAGGDITLATSVASSLGFGLARSGTGGVGGTGGQGGQGGFQGTTSGRGGIGGFGGVGGTGGIGGNSQVAQGGGIYDLNGNLVLGASATPITFTANVANSGLGGVGGTGGKGGDGFSNPGGTGGVGGKGGLSASAQGGGIYNAGGTLTITDDTSSANQANSGTGGAGGTGGKGGANAATGAPSANGARWQWRRLRHRPGRRDLQPGRLGDDQQQHLHRQPGEQWRRRRRRQRRRVRRRRQCLLCPRRRHLRHRGQPHHRVQHVRWDHGRHGQPGAWWRRRRRQQRRRGRFGLRRRCRCYQQRAERLPPRKEYILE